MLHIAAFCVRLVVIDQARADAKHVQSFEEGGEKMVSVGGTGFEGCKVRLSFSVWRRNPEQLDADVLGVGLVEETVHLPQRVRAVDDEA